MRIADRPVPVASRWAKNRSRSFTKGADLWRASAAGSEKYLSNTVVSPASSSGGNLSAWLEEELLWISHVAVILVCESKASQRILTRLSSVRGGGAIIVRGSLPSF